MNGMVVLVNARDVGAEVCGCDARNYCPNCGYEYKAWDGKIL